MPWALHGDAGLEKKAFRGDTSMNRGTFSHCSLWTTWVQTNVSQGLVGKLQGDQSRGIQAKVHWVGWITVLFASGRIHLFSKMLLLSSCRWISRDRQSLMYHASLTIQAVISFWRNYFLEFSGLCSYLKVFSNSLFKRVVLKVLKSHFGCSAKL